MANPEHELRLRQVLSGAVQNADLSNLDLSGMSIVSAKLTGVVLRGASLRRVKANGAYLQSADLSEANLAQANLTCADLRRVNLTAASLKGADLSSAVLQNAELRRADLTGCKLTRAMLTDAELMDANLSKCDLRGVRGVSVDQIRSARNWEKAIFDPGMVTSLGIDQDVATSRHGARKPDKKKCCCIDIICSKKQPNFGDLFVICGDVHPNFPPSGACDLTALSTLGFEQADDFFAVRDKEGDEIIWLYPLINNHPVYHQRGPFDGIRLECTRLRKAVLTRFLVIARAFVEALGGTLTTMAQAGHPGRPVSLAELEAEFRSR